MSYNHEPQYDTAPKYTVGLDLGQTKDYTALVILERHGEREQAVFHARHLVAVKI
jgi:phage terminase large subunit-like protein